MSAILTWDSAFVPDCALELFSKLHILPPLSLWSNFFCQAGIKQSSEFSHRLLWHGQPRLDCQVRIIIDELTCQKPSILTPSPIWQFKLVSSHPIHPRGVWGKTMAVFALQVLTANFSLFPTSKYFNSMWLGSGTSQSLSSTCFCIIPTVAFSMTYESHCQENLIFPRDAWRKCMCPSHIRFIST